MRAALGRVYLQAGQLDRAEAHFVAVAAAADVPESTKALNKAFLASARGEWDAAAVILRELFAEDDTNYAVSSWFFFLAHFGLGSDCAPPPPLSLRLLIILLWRFLVKGS